MINLFLLSATLFLLLINPSSSFAVTDFDVEVRDSGGDYTSITNAESAFDVDLKDGIVLSHGGITGTIADGSSVTGQTSGATGTAVHVTSDQIGIYAVTGTFQNGEQIYLTENTNYVTSSSAPDDMAVSITVYNNQSSGFAWEGGSYDDVNKVEISGDTSTWDGTTSGGVTITGGGQWGVSIRDGYVSLHNFVVTGTDDTTIGLNRNSVNTNLICDGCGIGSGYEFNNSTYVVINSVSIDSPGIAFTNYVTHSQLHNVYYYNCTAINPATYGFDEGGTGSVYAYNSVVFGAGTSDYNNSTSSGDYNACSDTSCSSYTNNIQSLTMADELEDGANGDVHLLSTSNLIDEGNDYSSTTGISYDIDLVTRSGTWDIGADEFISTVTGGIHIIGKRFTLNRGGISE
jgi:hypothetical protein